MRAELICVTPPTGEQLKGFEAFAARQCEGEEVSLDVVIDASLKSGFILRIGTKEYDWSERGRIEQFKEKLSQKLGDTGRELRKSKDVLSGLKANIDEYRLEASSREFRGSATALPIFRESSMSVTARLSFLTAA